jgi:hypothetical protein
MIDNSAILQKPQIPKVVNDNNGSSEMSGILLAHLHVFMLAQVVAVHVESRALEEQVLVTAEFLVVAVVQFEFGRLHLPYVTAQVVGHCVLEIVPVWEVLVRVLEDEFLYRAETTHEWQDWLACRK